MKKMLSVCLCVLLLLTLCMPLSALGEGHDPLTLRLSSEVAYSFNPETDAMAKYINEKFGLTFENVPYEGLFETMMLDAQSGALADVMYTEPLYDLYSFALMIESGFFRPIPDEMLEKFPLLKKQIESSEVCEAVRVHFGGNYILPKPDCTDPTVYLGERKGIFIRKDWLKKVGLEIPTTWDAFYEVCKAFTLNDPDGNGVNDTYGLTGDSIGNLRYFFSSLGHSNMNWVKQADGTWTHGALMEDNIQLLELLRKMYAEGLIDPEIGSTKWEQAMQKFASNTFGMVIRNADADWINNVLTKNYWEANKDKGNPYDIIGLIPALSIKKEDKPSMDAYIDCMCATMVNADLSDESLERYLEFHEWCMAGEGELMRLGFENVDWKYDEAGKIVKLLDEKGNPINLAEKYPCIAVTYMPTWGFRLMADPNIQTYDNFNDECKALNAEACAVRNANIVKSDMRVKLISAQSMLDANAFKFTVEYWNIVSGTEPVADMFHAMVDRAMQDGFAQAIEDVNAICKEKGW